MALNPNPNRSFKNNNEIDSRQVMTNKIIQEMNNGTLPWQAPWPKGLVKERQRNPFSETEYKGMNLVTLELAGFGDPRWMTYNQASKNGMTIPRGTKGKRIEYWTMKEYTVKENVVDPDTGEISVVEIKKQRPIGKTFTVFNAEQVEGMPPFKNEATKHLPEKELNERAEKLLKATGAQVMFDSPGEAFYDKYTKVIHLSPRYTYNSTYDMYSSILHQLAHWTSSKMDRKIPDITEDKDGYMREELRVELACYFLAHDLGIGATQDHIKSHASCIAPWVKLLKINKHEIFRVAREGEKIYNFLMDYVPEYRRSKPIDVEEQVAEEQAKKELKTIKEANTRIERDITDRADREDRENREEQEKTEAVQKEEAKKKEEKQEEINELQAEDASETKKIEEQPPQPAFDIDSIIDIAF